MFMNNQHIARQVPLIGHLRVIVLCPTRQAESLISQSVLGFLLSWESIYRWTNATKSCRFTVESKWIIHIPNDFCIYIPKLVGSLNRSANLKRGLLK